MKQWGIALHAYHDVNGGLPAGCAALPNGGAWGYSWIAYILPQVEQGALYQKFNFNNSVWNDANNSNVANGLQPKTFYCPSSPMPLGTTAGDMASGSAVYPTTNYVAIAGSASDPSNRISAAGGAGIVSGGGALFPNSKVKLTDITDGTTNQLLVGEHGDYMIDTSGAKQEWRASKPHSAFMGFDQAGTPANGNMNNDNRAFNTTTIRYQLNMKKGTGGGGWSGDCAGTGVCYNEGNNIPLNSAHPGGVMFLFGDGSVRFLTDSTPLTTLQQLATKDDGVVVSLP